MAKINILFNNKNYNIDESSLSSATDALRSHLSTVMNGTGTTVYFDDVSYNIDSSKLADAKNDFISHIETVAGSGSSIIVDGVKYGVDSMKISDSITDIQEVLGRLGGNDDENQLPISWNSLAIIGNPYFDTGEGLLLIKISDDIISQEEFNQSEVVLTQQDKDISIRLLLQEVAAMDGITMANYYYDNFYIILMSVTTTNEIVELGVSFPEVGTYAMDISQILGDIDCTLREYQELPTPSAPPAPTAISVSSNTIILDTIDGCEYSIDGINWKEYTEFGNLMSETEYTFYARYKATATHNASESSSSTICTSRITISLRNVHLEAIGYTDETTELIIPEYYYNSRNERCYITEIDSFSGCTNLTSVVIPNSVTSINSYAFSGCTNLTSVTIPDSVTSIGVNAFNRCTSLTSITIPNSVISIGDNAFYGCTNLTSVIIPDGVTTIGSHMFSYCTNLTSVTIPDSVASIERGAFCKCENLSSIIIPNSVINIGEIAFEYCTNLYMIDFEGTIDQWNVVSKGEEWCFFTSLEYVECFDGQVEILREWGWV